MPFDPVQSAIGNLVAPLASLENHVEPVNIETAKDRELEPSHSVRYAYGRNNLVAASQVQNLYFTCYQDEVWIYEPCFPYQALGVRPTAILKTLSSDPNTTGYLDPEHKHGINFIVVDYLGREEVLITAHDDGDVYCFMLRNIVRAMTDRTTWNHEQVDHRVYIEPRVFWQRNLGASAWGIAIHAESYKIAFSHNHHCVEVFVLPVYGTTKEPNLDVEAQRIATEVHRSHHAHHYNIPSVSFLNSPSDPTGRLLASLDLTAALKIWDLDTDHIFGFPRSALDHSGWAVLMLDMAWFQPLSTTHVAVQLPEGLEDENDSWYYESILAATNELVRPMPDLARYSTHIESEAFIDASSFRADSFTTVPGDSRIRHKTLYEDLQAHEVPVRRPRLYMDDVKNATTKQDSSTHVVLCASERNLYLRDHSGRKTLQTFIDLFQVTYSAAKKSQQWYDYNMRLNMMKVIPELGMVIAGSRFGLVAVFSLISAAQPTEEDPKNREYKMRLDATLPHLHQNRNQATRLHGFAITPMQGRSSNNDGRSQQWRKKGGKARYRLFLEYDDGAIFSYELNRAD